MNRPITGQLVFADGAIEIVGMIADAPQPGMQVGHAVLDDVLPLVRAIGEGGAISLVDASHPAQPIEVTVIEFRTNTIRFRING